ncbi:hypothetical protein [Peribacillus simplex]|uniref:hypothetical protein n=1 Tax=Peribacillus simplex TaxID=1478 RepID=UPI0016246CA4|nr:hypothetical protein [Peribacillus simplex]
MRYEKWLNEFNSKKLSSRNFWDTSGKVALATTIGLTISNSLANKDVEALSHLMNIHLL